MRLIFSILFSVFCLFASAQNLTSVSGTTKVWGVSNNNDTSGYFTLSQFASNLGLINYWSTDASGIYRMASAIERFRINNDGTVNIGGITTRDSRLNLLGAAYLDSIVFSRSSGWSGIRYTGANLSLNVRGNTRLEITPTGRQTNIGINNNTFINGGNETTTGTFNTAIGTNALIGLTSGNLNAAFGTLALYQNTTGSSNTAVGMLALGANTTGGYNTAFGQGALSANTTGSGNFAVGQLSLAANTTANFNTALGNTALTSNTTGSNNTGVAPYSLTYNTTGSENAAFGHLSSNDNTTGSYNTSIGNNSNRANQTGNYNTMIGYRSGYYTSINNVSNVIAIGSVIPNSIFATNGMFLGNSSNNYLTLSQRLKLEIPASLTMADEGKTWVYNSLTSIGDWKKPLNSWLMSNSNNISGTGAGAALVAGGAGQHNTLIGLDAGKVYSTQGQNINIGGLSGDGATSTGNVALGWATGRTSTGGYNFFGGYNAGYNLSSGNRNVIIGLNQAVSTTTTGNDNVHIGTDSGAGTGANTGVTTVGAYSTAAYANSSAFGYQASASAANSMKFGNSSVTDFGFGANNVQINTSGILLASGKTVSGGAVSGATGSTLISAQQADASYEKKLLSGSSAISTTITNGSVYTASITVTGAAVGDLCVHEFQTSDIQGGLQTKAMVTFANTVTVYIFNDSGTSLTFSSTQFKVKVFK